MAQQPAPAIKADMLWPPAVTYRGEWPRILPRAAWGGPTEQAPAAWPPEDVERARTRCAALLKGLNFVAVPAAPMREGGVCGTPAPMQLVSIGNNPQIAFSPPAVLTCDMIAALHRWLENEVQPLARKHLGAPVVGVSIMSSFSCRNAYGRINSRLSEHGRVNALDIGAFLTARGETVRVVADWGPIAREVAAQAIAERAEAIKKQAEAAAAARQRKAVERAPPAAPATVKPAPAAVTVDVPGIVLGAPPSGLSTGLGWAPPSRLGGPKSADAAQSETAEAKAAFLRAAHRAACKIFATVLGPEADSAHRNHFHLDLAERKSAGVCE